MRHQETMRGGTGDRDCVAFCEEGLKLWFNMDTPSILAYLDSNRSLLESHHRLPTRLQFLVEATKQPIPLDKMDELYRVFLQSGDYEAAAAAAGAGIASIWDSGRSFHRYGVWYERINRLLEMEGEISPLACCSSLGFKGLVELTWKDIENACETYARQRIQAEQAGSHSLILYSVAARSYCSIWMGKLSEAEVEIEDAEALCAMPGTNIVVRIYFRTAQGLFHFITGNTGKAKEILQEVVELPFFEELPPPAYLLGYGHLLLTVAGMGDEEAVEKVAGKLRVHIVPEQNDFHLSYLHYNLGTAYLMMRQPRKALAHGNAAMERAVRSGSKVAEQIPALLIGQALSDMHKDTEALAYLQRWIGKWKENGFFLLASSGYLEISGIHLRNGRLEAARAHFKQASDALPEGEEIVYLNRSADSFGMLRDLLNPVGGYAEPARELSAKPISITTFGDLQIRLGDVVVYDRKWKGGRTKALLKALIVLGGTKVSYEQLIDLLWPDTSGDTAENNLKVTLWRLRRIGCRKNEKPMQWILVKQRKVSLARPLCVVDSILFKETMDMLLREAEDTALLTKTLDLYQDDFLARDDSETWIVRHREMLREDFIKGVLLLYELCRKSGDIDVALSYLRRAAKLAPTNEEVYATIMQAHIENGYPSQAAQVYRQAAETLADELGIAPGPKLQALARRAGLKP